MTRHARSQLDAAAAKAASAGMRPHTRQNVRQITAIEEEARARRSRLSRAIDAIAAFAGQPIFLVVHVAWFATWIGWNLGPRAFDPYPFNFLTLVVSLEAILLSAFVLMAQNRMAEEADRRARLDLQVNLLAEQELTAILRVLCQIADKTGVDLSTDPVIQHFRAPTDVQEIAEMLEESTKTPAKPRD